MKKYISFLLLTGILVMGSCSDLLDQQPYGVVAKENFYNTADDAEKAVTAAYKSFQLLDGQGYWNTQGGYTPMGDVTCADAQAHPDLAIFYQIQQSIALPSIDQYHMLYQRCYKGIALANAGLENIPGINMDEKLKNRYLGELYFIRGFWHFRLGYMFGTAPVVDKCLGVADLDLPNSVRTVYKDKSKSVQNYKIEKSELFDQAEADFKQALSLGLANHNSGDLMGRADNGAVKAYLVQILLYEHRWAEAKKELEDILSYGYTLLPNYIDNFNGLYDNNNESVFEIQYAALNNKGTDNFGTVVNSPNSEGYTAGGGWGWTRPTPDLEREFEEGDPRLVCTMFRKGKDDLNGQVFVDKVNGCGLGTRKWCIPSNQGVTVDPSNWWTSANYTLVRYAEVLLWYAEVMNELGDQATAARYVNLVRKRTATTPNPNTVNIEPTKEMAPIAENLNYEQMFWAIVHERRVELGMEGKFGWDLRRWGITEQILLSPDRWQNQQTPGYFKYNEDKDVVFPIPLLEIQRSKGILQQNPGYE
jgi:hypothetical protein